MTSILPMSTHRRMSFHFPFPSDLPRGMDILHKIYLRQHGFQMKGIVQAEQCVMYVCTYVRNLANALNWLRTWVAQKCFRWLLLELRCAPSVEAFLNGHRLLAFKALLSLTCGSRPPRPKMYVRSHLLLILLILLHILLYLLLSSPLLTLDQKLSSRAAEAKATTFHSFHWF